MIQSDFTLWAAPLRMGFPSVLLKKALDKCIPLIHPYSVVDRGEAHHRPRYPHYPRIGLLVEAEADTGAADLDILGNIFSRTAINLKSQLEFLLTTGAPVDTLAGRITRKPASYVKFPRHLPAIPGQAVAPPSHLTIFNGSPRGRKGNTPILLRQFGEGFASIPGHSYEIHPLNRLKAMERFAASFLQAEAVWLGFPLYTDAMPGMVKAFIEKLAPPSGETRCPPIGFLVQSGFPEALHSRYIERYLHRLAARLGAPYLGTIVKGGGEGVRLMPEAQNARLFAALQALGKGFAQDGKLDSESLRLVAGVERYPAALIPVFKVFLQLPIANDYWDSQLRANGVYGQRFAQPAIQA